MSNKNALLSQAKRMGEVEDQTDVSGDFGPNLPEEGKAPARFIGYVEMGTHPQPAYAGKPKDPCPEVFLTFEIFGKKNTREIEVDGKKKKAGRLMSFRQPKKMNERAKFYKLFSKMKGERDIKNMAEMLDEVFLVTIKHGTGKKSGRKYATFQAEDGSFMVGAPIMDKVNEEGDIVGTIDISDKCPPASVDHKLFVTKAPSLDQWNSIKIDGEYTRKVRNEKGEDTDEEETVSKNFMQETIMDSLDWDGSPMQALLLGLNEDEDEDVDEEEDTEEYEDDEDVDTEDDSEEDEADNEPDEEEEPAPEPEVKKKKTAKKSTTLKKSSKSTKKESAGAAEQKKTSTKSRGAKQGTSASTATKSPSKEEESTDDMLAELGL